MKLFAAKAYCNETSLKVLEVDFYEASSELGTLEETPFKALKDKAIVTLSQRLGSKGVGKNYESSSSPKRGSSFSERSVNGWWFWNYNNSGYFLIWDFGKRTTKGQPSVVTGKITLTVTPSIDQQIFRPDLWSGDVTRLLETDKTMRYEWTSQQKDSARSIYAGTLFGIGIPEVIARVDGDRLKSLTVSLYNRGDSGTFYTTEKGFNELASWICDALDARLGTKGSRRAITSANATRAQGMTWRTRDANFLLGWNGSKSTMPMMEERFARSEMTTYPREQFRPEYIRLIISSHKGIQSASKAMYGSSKLKSDANGDRYIDGVPMVDQGAKGYCAAAASERLMRYYGKNVDQHDVAKLMNAGRGGTRFVDFKNGLADLARRTGLRVNLLFGFDEQYVKKIQRAFQGIADQAKRRGTELDGADKTLLKQVRIAERNEYDKFGRNVKAYIDQGKPLLWALVLGISPEEGIPPQTQGGHMRLIIGYNLQQKQIIYTDTWGAGHEMKRMPIDDAWAATTGLFLVEP
ncbi:MAG: C39 family peptidase [Puniceicoccales bacterium]|nr:C39 family peptidase [Puniceicoccales bacterium]